ncbi:DUF4158 domain-containing protein [Nonomuraea solani]|uniref:DUF4158 domain-containing protein n=1 Tax=Nonomuraea solani TaxID=1144553 RepID=UPI003898EDDE
MTFLHGRAWTHAEGPTALFDQSVAWLRRHRVLLPGVTVLERLVASVREQADERLYATVTRQVERVDAGLPRALAALLVVPEGARISELERLRQAPKRQSGTEMVKALKRVDDIAAFELGRVRVGKVPVRRMKTLAKYGAGTKAPLLARLAEPRKTATMLGVTRSLEAEAIDDALDLFALLMATRLISPARRKSAGERLAMLPRLEKASKLLSRAGRVLVEQLDLVAEVGADLDVAALWTAVAYQAGVSKEQVLAALGQVEELVPEEDGDGSAEAALRAALADKYNTVRPFLKLLGESKALGAAAGGRQVLAAVRCLPELARRQVGKKPLLPATGTLHDEQARPHPAGAPHDALLRQARHQWITDPDLTAVYRRHRPMVERSIAWLIGADGRARKLRYRGVLRNDLWLHLRAAALNLRRLINLGLTPVQGIWTLQPTAG